MTTVRVPSSVDEDLQQLSAYWNGRFETQETWARALQKTGFRLDTRDDITTVAISDLEMLLAANSARRLANVTAEEHAGWLLGVKLLRSGYLSSVRILATLL